MGLEEVTGGSIKIGWLDIRCPCGAITRVGIIKALNKPAACKSCGYALDFWKHWNDEVYRDWIKERVREYWADV